MLTNCSSKHCTYIRSPRTCSHTAPGEHYRIWWDQLGRMHHITVWNSHHIIPLHAFIYSSALINVHSTYTWTCILGLWLDVWGYLLLHAFKPSVNPQLQSTHYNQHPLKRHQSLTIVYVITHWRQICTYRVLHNALIKWYNSRVQDFSTLYFLANYRNLWVTQVLRHAKMHTVPIVQDN